VFHLKLQEAFVNHKLVAESKRNSIPLTPGKKLKKTFLAINANNITTSQAAAAVAMSRTQATTDLA